MCQACVTAIFRARIDRSEVKAFVKQDRDRMLQRTRLLDQAAMQGEGRWGTPMTHNELIRKLTKVIPNLFVTDGNIPGDISLYRVRGEQVEFICYTNSGTLPEHSIVHVNKDNQPIHEQRGWRTVLIRIIKSGLLSEQDAEREFGHPSSPQQAMLWDRELFTYRNRAN
jgi:hypothetical protein